MRDYQRMKKNPYLLPKTLYKSTLGFIRDYDRKRIEYSAIIKSPAPKDGQPTSRKINKPTERAAIMRATIKTELEVIEEAIGVIPEEYRKGVWENIIKNKRYPSDAAPRTYAYYKQRFIYQVAKNLYWIE